ncbi:MAG TPA: hypothetical protein VF163_05245 [Micromonosporaceae bacterium]
MLSGAPLTDLSGVREEVLAISAAEGQGWSITRAVAAGSVRRTQVGRNAVDDIEVVAEPGGGERLTLAGFLLRTVRARAYRPRK